MAYEEEQAKRSRVVVDTPHSRREVVQTEAYRTPDAQGVSGAMLAVIVIGAIALATVIILFAMNQQRDAANTASQTPAQQTTTQQPAQQPPVVIQQPAPATQPAPVIITQAPASGSGGPTNAAPDDSAIQTAIDKKLSDDPVWVSLGVTATVTNGKATLMGTVKSEQQKAQLERLVRNVKGVKSVDNQIVVG